jgi:hypothetical protein
MKQTKKLTTLVAGLMAASCASTALPAQELSSASSIDMDSYRGEHVQTQDYQFMYGTDKNGTVMMYDFDNDGTIDLTQTYDEEMPADFVHTMISHQLYKNGLERQEPFRETQQPIPAVADTIDGQVLAEEPFPNVYRLQDNDYE